MSALRQKRAFASTIFYEDFDVRLSLSGFRQAFTSSTDAGFSPSQASQSSGAMNAGIRSVGRVAISWFAGMCSQKRAVALCKEIVKARFYSRLGSILPITADKSFMRRSMQAARLQSASGLSRIDTLL